MSFLTPITGVDGGIAWLRGTSTAMTAEVVGAATTMPGSPTTYPANHIFSVTARTKKVLDPRVPLVVKNGGVAMKETDYFVEWGAGIVFFYTALTGTPTITFDGAYIPTATGTDVQLLQHVNNWQQGTTGNQIPGDEYGKKLVPNYRGKMSGTFQFDYFSSSDSIDLFHAMQIQDYFILALYESIIDDRLRIVYCDLTGMPENAPGNGMVGGTIQGVLKEMPTVINEAL